MLVYITHQKATAVAKKNKVLMPDRGEEYLVGKVGAKLGKSLDGYMGKHYYLKLYGGLWAINDAKKEFNI